MMIDTETMQILTGVGLGIVLFYMGYKIGHIWGYCQAIEDLDDILPKD